MQTLTCVRLAAGEECGTLILANFGVKLLWRHYWLKYILALQLRNFLLNSEIGGYTLDWRLLFSCVCYTHRVNIDR